MKNISDVKPKSNVLSYITLFLITGVVGSLFVVPIGHLITKIVNRPITSFDNYGWRGVGTGLILFGIYSLLIDIIVIINGETDSITGTLFTGGLFGVVPILIGKKLIFDWF